MYNVMYLGVFGFINIEFTTIFNTCRPIISGVFDLLLRNYKGN